MRRTLSSFALGFALGFIGAGLAAGTGRRPAAEPVSDWRTWTYTLRPDAQFTNTSAGTWWGTDPHVNIN
jgi:hypothetical protein